MSDLVRALAFGGSITLTSIVTRALGGHISNVDAEVPLRPPGWVFGAAWSILFVTTGVAWSIGRADVSLAIVTALCCAWLVVYTVLQWRRVASLVLMATVVASTAATVLSRGPSRWLLTPLVVWTAFASYLNAYDAW